MMRYDGSYIHENMDVIMDNISKFNVGDFVQMIKELYLGYYAVVLSPNLW